MHTHKRIVIVGGGFSGVRTALELSKRGGELVDVTLISSRTHFEYLPSLFRLVSGHSPSEVCIPLSNIFEHTSVTVVHDTISKFDIAAKTFQGESGKTYEYDYTVLALGSEPNYFNIPGMQEESYSFGSIKDALNLQSHLHEVLTECKLVNAEAKTCAAHILIVGGGPTGVELAGSLAKYTRNIATQHQLDPSFITIDLIEAGHRLLGTMPADFSHRMKMRLHALGVNIFLNRKVIKNATSSIFMNDMQMETKTVIWTAGSKPSATYSTIDGLQLNDSGRIVVDEFLRAEGTEAVFISGDGAATDYSGTAQTAISDGKYVARTILSSVRGKELTTYTPHAPIYAVPAGKLWAGVVLGSTKVYGIMGWCLRQAADIRFFLSILPIRKAWLAIHPKKSFNTSCDVCG